MFVHCAMAEEQNILGSGYEAGKNISSIAIQQPELQIIIQAITECNFSIIEKIFGQVAKAESRAFEGAGQVIGSVSVSHHTIQLYPIRSLLKIKQKLVPKSSIT